MALLGHNSYLPVIAIRKDYRFLCLDEIHRELILKNISLIAQLESSTGNPADRYYKFFDHVNEDFKAANSPLENIFLNSVMDPRDFISNEKDFYQFYDDKIICAAEIFKGNEERSNYGAGRNIILRNLELKGCGRNNAATRLDYNHAWGGMYVLEAIYEFLLSNIVNYSTPLGAERSIAIGISSEEKEVKHSTPAVLLRERSSPRVSMSNKTFEANTSLTCIAEIFSKPHFLEEQILHYLTMNFNGFFHKSMTLENATLGGKILDCNSIAFTSKRNGILGSILLNPHQELETETFQSILKAPRISVENNSLKNFYHLINSISHCYQKNVSCDGKFDDSTLIFKKILKQLVPSNDLESINNLVNNLFTLPSTLKEDKTILSTILENKNIEITNFKKIRRTDDSVFMIEFHIPFNLDLPNILIEFNQSRQSTLEQFLENILKALSFLPSDPHSLTDLLFKETLKMTQATPYAINDAGKVIPFKHSLNELKEKLIDTHKAESYLCFYQDSGTCTHKWHTAESILLLNKESIIYGIKTGKTIRPINPLYFTE